MNIANFSFHFCSILSFKLVSKKVDIRSRLEHLGERFQGFEEELILTKQKKKTDEDQKFIILQTQIHNIQSSLALESKNRAIAMKALQSVKNRNELAK